jgi:sugar/nucleoside kinase (ribokinase family)
MNASGPLLVVGELNPDVVVRGVPALRFGQAEDVVTSTTLTVGSSAAITACGAARLGAAVRIVGVVGDDEFGRFVVDRLRARGVDTGPVRVAPDRPTGSSVILVDASDASDRQILTHLGAMTDLVADDVSDDLITGSSHVHVGSWFLHLSAREQLGGRLAAARARGLSTSVDPNDDPDRTWDGGLQAALEHVELLFCNASEACGLSGLKDPDAAARALLRRLAATSTRAGLPAVVLKLGGAGARVYQHEILTAVDAPAVDVVDTVGAGDSLAAGVLASLLDDEPWPRAIALGVAAGSLSTTSPGGVDAQPFLDLAARAAAELTVRSTLEGAP